jgi:ketosteroid isomerase-like protein
MQELHHSSRPMRRLGLALGLAALLCGAPAWADDVADIGKLVRAGQLPAALQKADSALAAHPRDPQLRFLKGLILAEQNRNNEAIAVFQKLTEDYPQLPEPYNNLAVLYASAGQYDKARVSLERAIRTNPAYATAHENLGDVYAKLASQAYDKAMQLLDSKDYSPPKSKLAMVRTLGTRDGQSQLAGLAPAPAMPAPVKAPAAAPAQAAVPAPAPAKVAAAPAAQPPASAPVKVAAAVAAPAPVPAAPPKAAPPAVQPPAAALAAQQVNASAKQLNAAAQQANAATSRAAAPAARPPVAAQPPAAAPAPVQLAKADDKADSDAALKTVNSWAKAWSSQDMKGYLNAYADNFQTPRGVPRKSWEADRRARIEGKEHINVTVEAPQVSVKGDTATVRFRQIYVSDRLKANSRKTLIMEKKNGQWRIKQEQSGS